MIRKLLNAYWIVAVGAIIFTIIGDAESIFPQDEFASRISPWTLLLIMGSQWFSAAQFMAFGIACECLHDLGETMRSIAKAKEQPKDKLY